MKIKIKNSSWEKLGELPEEFEMAERMLSDTYPEEMRFPGILPVLYRKITDLSRTDE